MTRHSRSYLTAILAMALAILNAACCAVGDHRQAGSKPLNPNDAEQQKILEGLLSEIRKAAQERVQVEKLAMEITKNHAPDPEASTMDANTYGQLLRDRAFRDAAELLSRRQRDIETQVRELVNWLRSDPIREPNTPEPTTAPIPESSRP